MKRFFKILGIIIGLLILVFFILAFTQPKVAHIVRTRTWKASQPVVFDQVVRFKNWPHWSPWVEIEPGVKLTYEGVDGQPGSSYTWVGDETGSGKMTNIAVTIEKMKYELEFIKPWHGRSSGSISVEAQQTGEVKVTWEMEMIATFPFNALNFMFDHSVGKDLERGLELLEAYTVAHPQIEMTESNIVERSFPATNYATIRKSVSFAEMKDFSESVFRKIREAAPERIVGPPATFYYRWEDSAQKYEIGPAYALSGSGPLPDKDITVMPVPTSTVISLLYKGGYANLGSAHRILQDYAGKRGMNIVNVLEEYISGPADDPDSTKWATNVIFFVK
ncbi:SRPBCC family protein [Rurimicrobium arvi]|uniref:SRPBCC family protein n=1 Tax=Rurimicrobium arvi TaxID=2049916 RepID=A0ABP8MRA2_9BACT